MMNINMKIHTQTSTMMILVMAGPSDDDNMVVIKMKLMTKMVMTVMTMTMAMTVMTTVMMMTAGSAVARYGNAAHAAARRANRDIADDALKEIGPFSGFGSSFIIIALTPHDVLGYWAVFITLVCNLNHHYSEHRGFVVIAIANKL